VKRYWDIIADKLSASGWSSGGITRKKLLPTPNFLANGKMQIP
jgi:hypothetical protein